MSSYVSHQVELMRQFRNSGGLKQKRRLLRKFRGRRAKSHIISKLPEVVSRVCFAFTVTWNSVSTGQYANTQLYSGCTGSEIKHCSPGSQWQWPSPSPCSVINGPSWWFCHVLIPQHHSWSPSQTELALADLLLVCFRISLLRQVTLASCSYHLDQRSERSFASFHYRNSFTSWWRDYKFYSKACLIYKIQVVCS